MQVSFNDAVVFLSSKQTSRIIIHVDMDAFFAAIEQRDNPLLRGQPVIIGGPPTANRGVVSTCSYEARAYGIRSAMPLKEAARLCPHGIFLPVNMAKYSAVSRDLFRILRRFSPQIEPVSIDEAYLELPLPGSERSSLLPEVMLKIGKEIQKSIYEELHLTASVGLSWTKFGAKVASDLNKPNGVSVITPENFRRLIPPLSIEHVPGIGLQGTKKLHLLGLHTIGDLLHLSQATLYHLFGSYGQTIYNLIRGIDPRPVVSVEHAKSIGSEMTFPTDLISPQDLQDQLKVLAEEVSLRLERHGWWARTITLKARLDDFTTLTRSKTLYHPIRKTGELYELALVLLSRLPPRRPFRLLGISASNLTPFQQLTLF